MKDIRPLAPLPVVPTLPSLPALPDNGDWLGRDLGGPCLVEQALRSLPPEKRHGAVLMISCPCRRCSPWSMSV